MRQLRIHGPNDVRLDDVAEPKLGPRDVILRVAACGICGTDLSFIKFGGMDVAANGPMALGHEISGTVEAVGHEVPNISVGDRVAVHPGDRENGRIGNGSVDGGFADRLLMRNVVDHDWIHRIPDHLDLQVAALAEPVAVGMNAAQRATLDPSDKVVIFGGGPIGLAALTALLDQGNTEVVVVDLAHRRLELARELGATLALNPALDDVWAEIKCLHGTAPSEFGITAGTDAFIEASGAATVIGDVTTNAKPGASLTVVATHYAPIEVNFLEVLTKQLVIRGAMEYPDDFDDAIKLLGRRDLSAMITHSFAAERFSEALQVLANSRECGKIMITFPEG